MSALYRSSNAGLGGARGSCASARACGTAPETRAWRPAGDAAAGKATKVKYSEMDRKERMWERALFTKYHPPPARPAYFLFTTLANWLVETRLIHTRRN